MLVSNVMDRLLPRAAADDEVLAVLLYGSHARGDATPASDVDICVVLTPTRRSRLQLAQKRLAYLADVDLNIDIQIFSQLPLYIRQRVLKDGQVLYVRDESQLYERAFRTVQEFEDFRPHYQAYLREVESA